MDLDNLTKEELIKVLSNTTPVYTMNIKSELVKYASIMSGSGYPEWISWNEERIPELRSSQLIKIIEYCNGAKI